MSNSNGKTPSATTEVLFQIAEKDRKILYRGFRRVRKLLDAKDSWTKGCYARDRNGKSVPLLSRSACKWCLQGAMWKVFVDYGSITAAICAFKRSNAIAADITMYNDAKQRTHAQVIKALDKTIGRFAPTKAAS